MINLNVDDFKKIASDIFLCDSPTGYTHNVISLIAKYVSSFGYNYKITNKGTLEVIVDKTTLKQLLHRHTLIP